MGAGNGGEAMDVIGGRIARRWCRFDKLRNKGYGVIEAKNGDIALEALRDAQDPIDLIISDVVMPQRDGPTLIREVRGTHPDMKVIFISGYAEDDFRESLVREPGIHFLAKPFSLDQLAGKVKDVLAT